MHADEEDAVDFKFHIALKRCNAKKYDYNAQYFFIIINMLVSKANCFPAVFC